MKTLDRAHELVVLINKSPETEFSRRLRRQLKLAITRYASAPDREMKLIAAHDIEFLCIYGPRDRDGSYALNDSGHAVIKNRIRTGFNFKKVLWQK